MVDQPPRKRQMLAADLAGYIDPYTIVENGRMFFQVYGLSVLNAADAARELRVMMGKGKLASFFSRDGRLVHVSAEGEAGYEPIVKPDPECPDGDCLPDHDGPAQVRTAKPDFTTAAINLRLWPYKPQFDKKGEPKFRLDGKRELSAAQVTRPHIELILSEPEHCPNLRELHGVTHTPTVRADGSILTAPGYDLASKVYHLPTPGLIVPAVADDPSGGNIAAARRLLDYMIAGFPFVSDNHRANYIGSLFTPLLREIVPPPYKLINITAPQPGSGKTLLASVLRTVHGGVVRSELPGDDIELSKQVSAILDMTTAPVVTFDNVTGQVRSSVLAGLLTSAQWDDRRLGKMSMISQPNDRLWTLTGNNVSIAADLPRRTITSEIDPKVPNPQDRTGFAITDLEGWTADNRGKILWALLTLIRAWSAAGRPLGREAGSDGYALWVRTVRGILDNAGFPGEFDAVATKVEVGEDDAEWGEFLAVVDKYFPSMNGQGPTKWSVRDVLDKVDTRDVAKPFDASHPIAVGDLPSDLADKLAKARGNTSRIARPLGHWLRNRTGRWAGHEGVKRTVRSEMDPSTKTKRYYIETNP